MSLPGIETWFLDCRASRSLRTYSLRCLGLCFRKDTWKISGCNSERGCGEKIAQWGASYPVLVAWGRGVGTDGWDVKHACGRWEMDIWILSEGWKKKETLRDLDLNRVGYYMNLREAESQSVDLDHLTQDGVALQVLLNTTMKFIKSTISAVFQGLFQLPNCNNPLGRSRITWTGQNLWMHFVILTKSTKVCCTEREGYW